LVEVDNDLANGIQFIMRSSTGSIPNEGTLQVNQGPLRLAAIGANSITLATNGSDRLAISSAGALSAAGAATWSGLHTFSNNNEGLRITGNSALLGIQNTSASTDQGRYRMYADTAAFVLSTLNDAASVARNILAATRGTGAAISDISLGNATDNNTFAFLGTGNVQFGGSTTGAQTATFIATNKPGSGTAGPIAWIPVKTAGGTQGYVPVFGA
jgi:hypothetical protein